MTPAALIVFANEGKSARFVTPRLGPNARCRAVPDQPLDAIKLDENSEFGTILRAQTASAYLVRPDEHIAARWYLAQPHAVATVLQRFTAGECL